jgi:hypothetical protein
VRNIHAVRDSPLRLWKKCELDIFVVAFPIKLRNFCRPRDETRLCFLEGCGSYLGPEVRPSVQLLDTVSNSNIITFIHIISNLLSIYLSFDIVYNLLQMAQWHTRNWPVQRIFSILYSLRQMYSIHQRPLFDCFPRHQNCLVLALTFVYRVLQSTASLFIIASLSRDQPTLLLRVGLNR